MAGHAEHSGKVGNIDGDDIAGSRCSYSVSSADEKFFIGNG